MPIIKYPLDITGVNPANKIVAEPHTLTNRRVRAIALEYGAFFVESVQIKDVATGNFLNNTQFKCVELQELPTARYGKSICGIILINDQAVSQNIEVTYQVLGGDYASNSSTIVNMLNNVNLDDRPVNWPSILNKPSGYNPSPHLHDVGDVYGFEYVVNSIERLRSVMLLGDESAHDELRRYIDAAIANLQGQVGGTGGNLTQHTLDRNNPHVTTKAQVNLGLVDNYATASLAEANAGTAVDKFMTPALVKAAITQFAPAINHTHTFASITGKPTTLSGYGVTAVDVAGDVTTSGIVKVNGVSGNSVRTNAAKTAFFGAVGMEQGSVECITNVNTLNGGTLKYNGALHSFQGAIDSTGDITFYASDERLKKDITPIKNALDVLKEIGAYTYNWDIDKCNELGFKPDNIHEHGLIAQKVQAVYPEAVSNAAFNDEYLTVKHHRLVPLLLSGILDLTEKLNKAQEQIDKLMEV